MRKLILNYTKSFKKLIFWAVITIIIFIPLYMKFPLIWVKGSFVSIRGEDLIIFVTYILWAVYLIASKKFKSFINDRLNQTIILFVAIGLLSVISAAYLIHTVDIKLAVLHLARRVELMLMLPLLISTTSKKRQVYVYLFTFLFVLVLVNLYALGQRFMSFPVVSTINSELSSGFVYYLSPGDRVNSTFAGHYDLAVYLMMAVCILVAVTFYFAKRINLNSVNFRVSALMVILILLSLAVLIMTAARLSFFSVVAGICAALILVGKKKYLLLLAFLVAGVLIYPSQLRNRIVQTVQINLLQSFNTYNSQTEQQKERSKLNIPTLPQFKDEEETVVFEGAPDVTPGEPTDATSIGIYRSLNIRTKVEWPRALRAFYKNPFLGTGYSSIGLATDNDVLRSLGEVGLLGTWAFILVLIAALKKIILPFRKLSGFTKYFTAGCLAMVFAFLLNSLLIDVFEASKVAALFWMLLGIDIALINVEKNES